MIPCPSFFWPNNRPKLVKLDEMASRGMALECLGPRDLLGRHEAWFVDVFGRHELHLLNPDAQPFPVIP